MSKEAAKKVNKKITEEEFTLKAISALRKPPYKGIHTVYSGFNREFRNYFGKNPVDCTKRLAAEGKIDLRPIRGGALIYVKGEQPVYVPGERNEGQPKESPTLGRILGS